VVGGLVEEEIRTLQKDAAEGHPALLTTRQLRHGSLGRRQTQCVHRHLERPVQLPAVVRVDGILKSGLLGEELLHPCVVHRLAELVRDLVEPVQHVAEGLHPQLHVALHVQGRVQLRLLGKEAHPDARVRARGPEELAVLTGHDPKQGGLAGPVRPDDPDLRPREEGQVDALQDVLATSDLPEVLHGEDEVLGHGAAHSTARRPPASDEVLNDPGV
jgi:hypothetical protein